MFLDVSQSLILDAAMPLSLFHFQLWMWLESFLHLPCWEQRDSAWGVLFYLQIYWKTLAPTLLSIANCLSLQTGSRKIAEHSQSLFLGVTKHLMLHAAMPLSLFYFQIRMCVEVVLPLPCWEHRVSDWGNLRYLRIKREAISPTPFSSKLPFLASWL